MPCPAHTTEQFIERATALHGVGRYDYSKATYTRSTHKTEIICPKHGSFWPQAGSHLLGTGCPSCRTPMPRPTSRKPTQDSFIARAKERHGKKYGYDLCIYTKSCNKVVLKCSKHGEFLVRADKHLLGQGCLKCSMQDKIEAATLTTEEFISKCKEKGQNQLDFSSAVYTGSKSKVNVSCPIHGPLVMWAKALLRGVNCRHCVAIENAVKRAGTLFNKPGGKKNFTQRAARTHGQFYDYSLLPDVIKAGEKLEIICPQHGSFLQQGMSHLNGRGCPACGKTGWGKQKWAQRAKGREAILYVVEMSSANEVFYKAGITFRGVDKRFRQVEIYQVSLIIAFSAASAEQLWQIERDLKNEKGLSRYKPSCFFGGHTECYSSLSELLAIIHSKPLIKVK